MASNSRKAFDENLLDIERLIDFYKVAELLDKKHRKEDPPLEGKDVVLRSAIVLLVTYWEAYLEDITTEAIDLIVSNVSDPAKLPKDLKKAVLRELDQDKNELAAWKIAGEGWRKLLEDRLPKLQEIRNRSFNTPKSGQSREFFASALGIPNISKSWTFGERTEEENAAKLDALIEMRGQIAHRGKLTKSLTQARVSDATEFIKKLVGVTGGTVNAEVKRITGIPLFTAKKKA